MSRPTKKPNHTVREWDLFAPAVRLLLKRYVKCCERCDDDEVDEWTDEDALFLYRVASEPDFLDDAECALCRGVRSERAKTFAALNTNSGGMLIRILADIDRMVSHRTRRKGMVSPLYLVIANFALRQEALERCEASSEYGGKKDLLELCHRDVDSFWNDKAELVAGEYSELLGEKITPRLIEDARKRIRELRPGPV